MAVGLAPVINGGVSVAPLVFHPVHDTVEVVLFASRNGEERRNVIHYNYAQGPVPHRPSVAELGNLLADVELNIIDKYENFVSLGTVWYQCTARDIHDATGNQAARAMTRVASGPLDNMPGAVSHCLTKRTAIPGRAYRGRFYLIDLPEDYFNGDDLNAVYIPIINALTAEMLLTRQAGMFVPAVASRKNLISTPITSFTYDLIADTQTRRGKGRGV
jgi:hypothetical protein